MSGAWEKLRSGVKEGITKAGEVVQSTSSQLQTQTQIRSLQKERAAKVASLGATALELAKAGEISHPRLAEIVGGIEALDRQIADLQQAAGKAGAVCPSCGASVRPGGQFCNQCGAAMTDTAAPEPAGERAEEPTPPSVQEPAAAAPAQPPAERACVCGAQLKPGVKFCNTCGRAVGVSEPAEQPELEPPPLPDLELELDSPSGPPTCPKCAAEVSAGAAFCRACGERLSSGAEDAG